MMDGYGYEHATGPRLLAHGLSGAFLGEKVLS